MEILTALVVAVVLVGLLIRIRHNHLMFMWYMEDKVWPHDPQMQTLQETFDRDVDLMTEEEFNDFCGQMAGHIYDDAVNIKPVSEKVE